MRRGRLFQPSNLEECESIGQELTVRDLVEWKGTAMDVSKHYRARADLQKAFEEIKRLRDQLHDENVVLREQFDQAHVRRDRRHLVGDAGSAFSANESRSHRFERSC